MQAPLLACPCSHASASSAHGRRPVPSKRCAVQVAQHTWRSDWGHEWITRLGPWAVEPEEIHERFKVPRGAAALAGSLSACGWLPPAARPQAAGGTRLFPLCCPAGRLVCKPRLPSWPLAHQPAASSCVRVSRLAVCILFAVQVHWNLRGHTALADPFCPAPSCPGCCCAGPPSSMAAPSTPAAYTPDNSPSSGHNSGARSHVCAPPPPGTTGVPTGPAPVRLTEAALAQLRRVPLTTVPRKASGRGPLQAGPR